MDYSIYDTVTMQGIVERMPKTETFLADTFFTGQTPHTTEKIGIDFVSSEREIAPFVHPRNGAKVTENEGYETKLFTAPIISEAKVTDIDRLMKRMAGEDIAGAKTPEERAVEYLARDLMQMEQNIARRKEWMCAKAIFEGRIPIVGEGLNEEIDFDFQNKTTLAGKKLWSDDASSPTENMTEWKLTVSEKTARNACIAVCSQDVMMRYLKHPEIQKMLDIRNYSVGKVAPKIKNQSVTYFGTNLIAGVDLYVYNGLYKDPVTKKTERYVPAGTIALLPIENDFRMEYGAHSVIPEGGTEFVTYAKELVANTYVTRRPDRRFAELTSRPLPAPVEVDSWFVAKVL